MCLTLRTQLLCTWVWLERSVVTGVDTLLCYLGRALSVCQAANSVFTPVADQILRVRLKMHTGNVFVIAVYAPTNEPGI